MSAAVDEAGITRDWQQSFMLDTHVAAHDRPLLALLLGKAHASANFDWEEDPGSVLIHGRGQAPLEKFGGSPKADPKADAAIQLLKQDLRVGCCSIPHCGIYDGRKNRSAV